MTDTFATEPSLQLPPATFKTHMQNILLRYKVWQKKSKNEVRIAWNEHSMNGISTTAP